MEISIHALPAEGDYRLCGALTPQADFNPRPPRGGRQWVSHTPTCGNVFQSTPSPRRATHRLPERFRILPISIHALPAEGDHQLILYLNFCSRFQSTPSPRRATTTHLAEIEKHRQFQSTPSPRRATSPVDFPPAVGLISIHALPAEGDGDKYRAASSRDNFNPRPPRGGRHSDNPEDMILDTFQSTPSPRRATPAPPGPVSSGCTDFNPRPPRGGRLGRLRGWKFNGQISIHALPAEGDLHRAVRPRPG